jgi:DNA mismatch repair ATPase MutS
MDELEFDWGILRYDLESFYDEKYGCSFVELTSIRPYSQAIKKFVFDLPESVLSCLGVLVKYLQDFNLDSMLRMPGVQFRKLSSRYEMAINGVTLKNLEVRFNKYHTEFERSFEIMQMERK